MKVMNTGMKLYQVTVNYWGTEDKRLFPTKKMAATFLDWLVRDDNEELRYQVDPVDDHGDRLSTCIDNCIHFHYDDSYYGIAEMNVQVIVEK